MAVMTRVLVIVAMTLEITFIAQRTMKTLLICVPYEGTPVGRNRKASVVFTTQAFVETNSSIIDDLKLGRSRHAYVMFRINRDNMKLQTEENGPTQLLIALYAPCVSNERDVLSVSAEFAFFLEQTC